MAKPDYDAITRLMILRDGSVFLHLTQEQAVNYANKGGRVWRTAVRNIMDCTSDLYQGKSVWANCDYYAQYYHSEASKLNDAPDSFGWCVPVEEYNEPNWGEVKP